MNILIFIFVFFVPVYSWAACGGSSPTLTAASASQSDVMDCVAAATYGDTINVPVGTETWAAAAQGCTGNSMLCMKKGITLSGAGKTETIITLSGAAPYGAICYEPDATSISNNTAFTFTGFSIDGGGTAYGEGLIDVRNSSASTIISNIRITNNIFKNTASASGRGININGLVYGVADNNTFTNIALIFGIYSGDSRGWNNVPREYGTNTAFFVEDNLCNMTTASFNGCSVDHGQGATGVVYRYNTTDLTNAALSGLWIIHGLQSMTHVDGDCGHLTCGDSPVEDNTPCFATDCCAQWSTIKSEYYGNNIINSPNYSQWMNSRGSWLMMFFNQNDTSYATAINYTQYSCDECQTPTGQNAGGDYSQHVQNTYIWSNLKAGGTQVVMTKGGDRCGDYVSGGYAIAANTDYWNYTATFDGTAGVGCGILANRPATCTTGVGYWATDQDCSDLTGMVGASPATPISGSLHKCTSTNTWTADYYVPYAYPHPLRTVNYNPPSHTGISITGGVSFQ